MGDRDHAGSAPIDDRPTESELASAVVASRESADALAELAAPAIDPPLEAVLQNCRVALDALATQHARLADESDLDIDADTRWAARWQLAGAALAYANALVDLSDRGYVDPALPMSRALYESLGMLGVINRRRRAHDP